MSQKTLFRWLLGFAFLISVTITLGILATSSVSADCGTPPKSSCISCHTPGNHVEVMGEWNSVHLAQDMCINCHGGNGSTMDKDLAHIGMVAQPLSDIFTNCHSCHPADYIARSDKLAAVLNVTPGSCGTPTAIAVYVESGGSHTGRTALSLDNSGGIPLWKSIAIISGVMVSLGLFLLGLGWLSHHRIKNQR
jgi:hypothetical protein